MKQAVENKLVLKATDAACEALQANGVHIYCGLDEAVYGMLWKALNDLGPRLGESTDEMESLHSYVEDVFLAI